MNVATLLKNNGSSVCTGRPTQTLLEISQLLSERRIGAVVIVGDRGAVVGIASERDVVRILALHGAGALDQKAETFMTRNIVTCDKTATVDQLMAMMTRGRFRHVPVVEDDALVGIVSIGDIVKSHIAEVEMEVSAMRGYLATG